MSEIKYTDNSKRHMSHTTRRWKACQEEMELAQWVQEQ